MNIIITQDNSRVEVLGSNGISIILKLYELAIDPNNTLTLEGNISSTSAYVDLVTYLTTNYPDLIINANKLYITFRDSNVFSALLSQGIGDGTGITAGDVANATFGTLFKADTEITSFDEFKYFTKQNEELASQAFRDCTTLESIDLTNLEGAAEYMFSGCTNLKYFNGSSSEEGVLSLPNLIASPRSMRAIFAYCDNLTSVEDLGECTYLNETFAYCTNLTTVNQNIFNKITELQDNSFRECMSLEIEDLSIPNLTSIGNSCFRGARLIKTISNLGSIVSIPNSCFYYCTGLTSVNLPSTCISLGPDAFRECFSLTSINLENIVTLRDTAFFRCTSLTTIDISNVTNLSGSRIFADCTSLVKFSGDSSETGVLSLNSNVSINGDGIFTNTGVSVVRYLGENTTSLSSSMFNNCSNLTTIEQSVLDKIVTFGDSIFYNCHNFGASGVSLPNIETMGQNSFYGCNVLTSVSMPKISSIPQVCFFNCTNLTTVETLPLTYIGKLAFSGCKALTSVSLAEEGITTLYDNTFNGCSSLTSISLPSTLTTIENSAFYGTGLVSINIPDSVTTIGTNVFWSCKSLTSVIIGTGITSIGGGLLGNCGSQLVSLTIKATTPPTLNSSNMLLNDNNCIIYVPSASVDAYKAADGWSTYANRIQAITE